MKLDGMVFGMPPGTHVSDEVMKASMPTATIIPCEPEFSKGLSLFTLSQSKGAKKYAEILKEVGFSLAGNRIEVAYLADNFPTDTFNNEYGETFLDKFAQAASSGLGDLSQIMGWTSFDDMTKQMGNVADSAGKAGAFAKGVVDSASSWKNKVTDGLSKRNKNLVQSATNAIKGIVTGARVDFPQVWKNSSYTPSYSMTIRLYNPNPSDPESTKRYIVGPIAALVALAVPTVSEDATMYKWPLLCKVRSPGIYHLNAAYINSIAVIKGGDQQSIAYNQSLAMCDVRIDFGSLYNSILAGKGSSQWGGRRPTLGSYLGAIGGSGITSHKSRGKIDYKSKGPGESNVSTPKLKMKKNKPIADPVTPEDVPGSRVPDHQRLQEFHLKHNL